MTKPTPQRIRKVRVFSKLTQTQAAKTVGVSTRTWQRYEAGTTSMSVATWVFFRRDIRILSIMKKSVSLGIDPEEVLNNLWLSQTGNFFLGSKGIKLLYKQRLKKQENIK